MNLFIEVVNQMIEVADLQLGEVKFEMKSESRNGGDGFITLEEFQMLSA